jgi:glycosyltransferase involved in cell wall biosynthesis
MSNPLLSILTPTVVGRGKELNNLLDRIKGNNAWAEVILTGGKYRRHYGECKSLPVRFAVYEDDKSVSIGEKREDMYKDSSNGDYVWMIDDDDDIADNAIGLILEAIKSNPDIDCVCFKELVDIDGKISHSNFSLEYGDWEGDGILDLGDGFSYHRTPFFKTPIKTDICRQVGVRPIRFGEDHDFAQRIKPLLKTMVYIPEFIYYYIHRSTPFNERYGINQ